MAPKQEAAPAPVSNAAPAVREPAAKPLTNGPEGVKVAAQGLSNLYCGTVSTSSQLPEEHGGCDRG